MSGKLNRRQALERVGGTVLGVEALLALSGATTTEAAALTAQGAWLFTPSQGGQAAGFQAISCFAAGGVFVTIGSDEPGTGLGQWSGDGGNGFAFTYLNFHFGKNQKLNNTVKVRASGTFQDSSLTGQATLTMTDRHGNETSSPVHFTFNGTRIVVEAP